MKTATWTGLGLAGGCGSIRAVGGSRCLASKQAHPRG
jgi:hypothetical protein